MNSNTMNLRDLKKWRLDRHWSQEQLSDLSGLSIRTIQRIENGENAGLESLKALATVFETNIEDSNKTEESEQGRKKRAYMQKVRFFYMLLCIAILSMVIPIVIALNGTFSWLFVCCILLGWVIIIGIYSLNTFVFFYKE